MMEFVNVGKAAASRTLSRAKSAVARVRKSKRLVMRIAGLTAARAVGSISIGVSLILLARWDGPAEFGQFAVAWSIMLTTSGLLAFGLPTFALRAAVLGRREATGYALFLNLLSSIAAALIGAVLSLWLTNLGSLAIALLAVSVALERNAELRVGLGTEFGLASLVNWTLAVRGAAVMALMVVGYASGFGPLTAYIVGRVIAMGLSAIVLLRSVRGWPLTARPPRDGSLESLGSFAAMSIAELQQLDITLVDNLATSATAGLYAAVQKIARPISLLTGSLSTVVMGPAVRGGAAIARKAVRVSLLLAGVGLAVCGIIAIWSGSLVILILGDDYTAAKGAFAWVLIAIPALALDRPVSTLAQANGQARLVAWRNAILTPVRLAGVALGSALFGATGAAFAFAFATWLRFVWLSIAANRLDPAVSTDPPQVQGRRGTDERQ